MADKILFGGAFPITMERRDGRDIRLAVLARYDEREREVIVEDDYQGHPYSVEQVEVLNENEFRFSNELGERIILRPTRPDDAVTAAIFTNRIPLPVDIIGAFMTGTITEPTISAAVDTEGDVHTMILETGLGLYARYSRTWILMTDITPISTLDIVDVPATDLEHYDMADDLGKTISIRDLSPIDQPAVSAVGPDRSATTPVTAAVAGTVIVASVADLPDAIAYAATEQGTAARWYVGRRAKALGWTEPLPWDEQ
jgi:hypothetical protein